MTHNLGANLLGLIIWSLGATLNVNVGSEFAGVITVDEGTWASTVTWQYRVDPTLLAFVKVEANPESKGTLTATTTTANGQLYVGCKWEGTQVPIPAQPLGWVHFRALKPTTDAGVKVVVENVKVNGQVSEVLNEDMLVIRATPRVRFNWSGAK